MDYLTHDTFSPNMIDFLQVSKNFGNLKAVQSISFHVDKGENLILLGTSGCGKTTTLRMANRLIEPTSGSIKIHGKDVLSVSPEKLRRSIGYVIQNTGLFPHYTIRENISIVPRLLNWDSNKTHEKLKEILTKVHLSEQYLNSYPNELSGGQQQRVGLARALITDPPVILMDEPLGALDPITRNLIRKEFKTLEAIRDKTVLMVTHDVEEAFELGDKICLMDKGIIQQIGTPEELLFKPKNNFVRDFFINHRNQLQMKIIPLAAMKLSSFFSERNSPVDFTIDIRTSFYDLLNMVALENDPLLLAVKDERNLFYIEITQQELYKGYQKAINQLQNG